MIIKQFKLFEILELIICKSFVFLILSVTAILMSLNIEKGLRLLRLIVQF